MARPFWRLRYKPISAIPPMGWALILLGGVGVAAHVRKQRARVAVAAAIPTITFEPEGEDEFRLPAGRKVRVTWPSDSPFGYQAQPTDTVPVTKQTDTSITFRVGELPAGAVDQVFVFAVDNEGNVRAQHKLTFVGPG